MPCPSIAAVNTASMLLNVSTDGKRNCDQIASVDMLQSISLPVVGKRYRTQSWHSSSAGFCGVPLRSRYAGAAHNTKRKGPNCFDINLESGKFPLRMTTAASLYWHGRIVRNRCGPAHARTIGPIAGDPAACSLINVGQSEHAVIPMLLIGIGAGMPWGLMDGLSISVVPKERAGMATGIFNTTRVAGECIALAIAVAMLSAFAQISLQSALANTGAVTDTRIAEVAQRVASGDLLHAAASLPDVNRNLLIASYACAFQSLLYVLMGITVLSAIAAFIFLSCTSPISSDDGSSPRIVDSEAVSEYVNT